MADALKDFFSPALVRRLGGTLQAVSSSFPEKAFVRDATKGLSELELVSRAKHIARAMQTHLPPTYEEALKVVLRSLGPALVGDELEGVGMAPFFYMPHLVFVAEAGIDHFDASMKALHALTQRFTAEFAIRPFLERYPDETLRVLETWAIDPSAHVRRLVSEGTRPRLPWAPRVRWIEQKPERLLQLLELLKDDPAPVVRRSVANHLNDLAKPEPDRVAAIAKRWLRGASPERRALVEHALRSSVKRGHRPSLEVLGFGDAPKIAIERARFAPARLAIGENVRVSFDVVSTATSAKPQTLVVDLAVHFVKSKGTSNAKVFKISRVVLGPKEGRELGKTISLKVHTTRRPNPGRHTVDVLVNGEAYPIGAFVVTA